MQIEFERRIQQMRPEELTGDKLTSDTILSFLNEAIDKFYKTRYSGLNTKQEGFEQSQKRTDDLRTLVKTKIYNSSEIVELNSTYSVELPNDYTLLLGDTAGIQPVDDNQCWPKLNGEYVIMRADTLESSIETIDRQMEDVLSEFNLKYCTAKPLKLIRGNEIILYTDGKYKVSEYKITYLSKPALLTISDITNEEYTILPSHTHMEIVKIAVELYMATKPVSHYQAYAAEVATME